MKGRCNQCTRTREVARAVRYGGGTYRRGGRYYPSSICAECALGLLRRQAGGTSITVTLDRWSAGSLRNALDVLDAVPCAEPDGKHSWMQYQSQAAPQYRKTCRWCGVRA